MAETLGAMRPATYEDLMAVPDNLVAEILRGRLVTHPRPRPRHSLAASVLGGVLQSAHGFGAGSSGLDGWWILDEPELHLGPQGKEVAVPDLAGWRLETLPELPEEVGITTPPDWICEVLSPTTEKYDRGDKREIYAENGVSHLWFVDPRSELLETFELSGDNWLLTHTYRGEDEVAARPFEQASFQLALLFASPVGDPER